MKKFSSLIALIFSMSFYFSQEQIIINDIPMIKYEQLENKIKKEKDVVLVINFWSTTCAPCVKELPDFMEVNEKFKGNPKYKMLLVSLDRAKDKERVIEFIKKKNLTAEVVLLDDIKRMNTWIPRFEKNWDGNIPVTIFYKNGEKVHFNDGEMSKEELENTIVKNLN
ncbi:TlpA family protein disulfide reductase [Chryseobacterium sp. 3008163]|uniref:TlpA family protein disulfide reductase n=1 Tax=Chryseobacterium sp. 3008163 TaxID=2478663 RepID=UPI000F0D0EB4|nr:TlpA disulfide reductase family protein [Chryseobacterium sp. 3008163]AYN00732.1 TlpA family protein disulfide reductase [Chryseobacterium sp. 3008163]